MGNIKTFGIANATYVCSKIEVGDVAIFRHTTIRHAPHWGKTYVVLKKITKEERPKGSKLDVKNHALFKNKEEAWEYAEWILSM